MTQQNSFAKFFGAQYPLEGNVAQVAPTYGDDINILNGTLNTGGGVVPSPSDVRLNVAVAATVGNLVLPDVSQVLIGVTFGSNGTQFTGTLVNNVIPTPPAADMIRLKIQVAINGDAVDEATVKCTLIEANSIVNNNIDPSVTGNTVNTIDGYAEIDLYRQVAFTRGTGDYMIQVEHHGQILASIKAAMPDQTEIFLSELVALANPTYTGG